MIYDDTFDVSIWFIFTCDVYSWFDMAVLEPESAQRQEDTAGVADSGCGVIFDHVKR